MSTKSFYGMRQGSFYGGGMYGNGQSSTEAIEKELGPDSIVSFNDGLKNKPLKECVINIEPVQDLHGYEYPWPAGGGKNLYNMVNGTSSIYYNSSTGLMANSTTAKTVIIPCEPNTTYTVSKAAGTRFSVCYTKTIPAKNVECFGGIVDNTASSITITTGADAEYLCTFVWYSTGDSDSYTEEEMLATVQIEKGSTATAWTPYSNICPITGWTSAKVTRCGKNLFDKTAITPNSWIVVDTTTIESTQNYFVSDFIPVKAGQRTPSSSKGSSRNIYYDKFKNSIAYFSWSTGTLTPLYDGYIRVTGGNSILNNLQIEFGSTATAYKSYQGETYDITFPVAAGTVYGGTLDVTTGTLIINRVACRLDTLTWTYTTQYGRFSSNSLKNDILKPSANDVILNGLLCSAYRSDKATQTSKNTGNGAIGVAVSGAIYIRDERYTDVTAWLTEVGNQLLIYPLNESIVYSFTPQQVTTLLGTNNIWADTGNITIKYLAKK